MSSADGVNWGRIALGQGMLVAIFVVALMLEMRLLALGAALLVALLLLGLGLVLIGDRFVGVPQLFRRVDRSQQRGIAPWTLRLAVLATVAVIFLIALVVTALGW